MDRRTFLLGAAAGATLPLLAPASAQAAPTVRRVLASDLEIPWGLAFLPSGEALLGERGTGKVFLIGATGGKRQVGRFTVTDTIRGGLLGIAVSPTFAEDRWVYFFHTRDGENRILRRRFVDGAFTGYQVLVAGIATGDQHDGGRLAFGPDGMLYATVGDAGTPSNAQDLSSLNGKILRMLPDGGVPAGNPFGTLVWSYGHRNPQGIDWDGQGRMWSSELGQDTYDELNQILPGRNYGWPQAEGPSGGQAGLTDPFSTWNPDVCSPSGLAIARGQAWIGALRGRSLWSVRLGGPQQGQQTRWLQDEVGRIRTVVKAPDGSLWITTSNRDRLGTPGPGDDRLLRVTLG